MIYCQLNNGDVFMYNTPDGFIECCTCLLAPMVRENVGDIARAMGMTPEKDPDIFEEFNVNDTIQLNSRTEALEHLLKHREAGHIVPEYAVEKLQNEIESLGDTLEVTERSE